MLSTIAWASLAIAFACAIVIAVDEIRYPQKTRIMNLVWPITSLYFSVFGLWGYFRAGRRMTKAAIASGSAREQMQMTQQPRNAPTFTQAAISDSHCGAGCVLGDIIAEFSLFVLGWTLLGKTLYAEYAGDSSVITAKPAMRDQRKSGHGRKAVQDSVCFSPRVLVKASSFSFSSFWDHT